MVIYQTVFGKMTAMNAFEPASNLLRTRIKIAHTLPLRWHKSNWGLRKRRSTYTSPPHGKDSSTTRRWQFSNPILPSKVRRSYFGLHMTDVRSAPHLQGRRRQPLSLRDVGFAQTQNWQAVRWSVAALASSRPRASVPIPRCSLRSAAWPPTPARAFWHQTEALKLQR